MKKYILIPLFLFAVSLVFSAAQAQNDDANDKDKKDKKNKKEKISIKIDKNAIPSDVSPGGNFTVNFTIKNNSKKAEWNYSGFTYETDQPYTGVIPMSETSLIIPPGEEKSFSITITAPVNEGKEKLKMTFYNDGKKIKQLEKMINIGSVKNNETNQDDDGKNKNDDKDKDKNKNKNEEKNKSKQEKKNQNDN